MAFFLLYLLFYYGFIYVAAAVELFLIGKRLRRGLLPILLLFMLVPFHTHITYFGDTAIKSAMFSPRTGEKIMDTPPQFAKEAVQRFEWTGYSLMGAFYVVALALTWRIPFLAPLLPLAMLFLYHSVTYQPFSHTVQTSEVWLDDYTTNTFFFIHSLLLSLCFLGYTLPSLLRHMEDTTPEALRREVEPRA